jgi:hypothetical protein
MKTIEINLYKFSELSEELQQKAIEKHYDINVNYEWWDGIYQDAENIGLKLTGFDLDRNRHATGEFIEYAVNCAEKIIKEHGEGCETYKTAQSFLSDYKDLVAKYSDGVKTDEVTEENEYEFDCECDDLENDFLNSILEDYSILLQQDYEYQTSKEAIIETIEANDYDFTENGEMY